MDFLLSVKNFVKWALHSYLEDEAFVKVEASDFSVLERGFSGIACARGLADRAQKGFLRITSEWYHALPVSERLYVVSGEVRLSDDDIGRTEGLRFAVSCGTREAGRFYLVCADFSVEEALPAVRTELDALQEGYEKILEEVLQERTEELNRKTQDLELLTDNIPGGVFKTSLDVDFTIRYVSDGYLNLMGYTREQLARECQSRAIELVHREDREQLRRDVFMQAASGHGDVKTEHRALRRDGTVVWISLRGRCLDMQGEKLFVGVVLNDTEEKLAKQKLQSTVNELRTLTETIPGGVVRMYDDKRFRMSYMSDGFLELYGYTRAEVGAKFRDEYLLMIHPEDREQFRVNMRAQLTDGKTFDLVYRGVDKNRQLIWLLCKGQQLLDDYGINLHCVMLDITNTRRAEEALRISEERYRILSEQSDDIIFDYNIESESVYVTETYTRKFGQRAQLFNKPRQILDRNGIHPDDFPIYEDIYQRLCAGEWNVRGTLRLATADGGYLWCELRMTQIFDDFSKPVRVVGRLVDVNDEYMEREHLIAKSQRDLLTGLYNKMTTQTLIEDYLKAEDSGRQNHALFIIDVDNFKGVNDSLGHLFGDAVLSEIAAKVQNLFRGSDIIGRIGGDEFVVFLKDLPNGYLIEDKAQELVGIFRNTYSGSNRDYKISGSIGAARYPQDSASYQGLFQKADLALYYAKKNGKDQYAVYNAALHAEIMGSGGSGDNCSVLGGEESLGEMQKPFEGHVAEYIFRIFSASKDINDSIRGVLNLVGHKLAVDRTCIFEMAGNEKWFELTHEWHADSVGPISEQNRRLPLEKSFENSFDENGIFFCTEVTQLPPELRQKLGTDSITSFIQAAIRDEDRFCGFVSFCGCGNSLYPTSETVDSLKVIAQIVSMFLLKKHMKDQLVLNGRVAMSIMNSIDLYAYIIEPESHQLLFVNEKTKRLLPETELGGYCYDLLRGRGEPCADCPMRRLGPDCDHYQQEFYNEKVQRWLSATASRLVWSDGRIAHLMSCCDITAWR